MKAPSPSNPGLPAGKGEGASTFSGSTKRGARGLQMRNGEGGAAWWRLRFRPPPRGGGHAAETSVRRSYIYMPYLYAMRQHTETRIRVSCATNVSKRVFVK